MDDDRGVDEEAGRHGLRFFDARPGQVDVEEEKEDTKADNGTLKRRYMLALTWYKVKDHDSHRIGYHLFQAG